MKRILILILFLLVGLVAGRKLGNTPRPLLPNTVAPRAYAISVVYNFWPGWSELKNSMQRMSDNTPGLKITFGGIRDNDAAKQIEELELLIARKVNGIVLFTSDSKALRLQIDQAVTNGIPVITLFGDSPDSKRLTFISADERGSARRLTQKVAEKLSKTFDSKRPAKVLLTTGSIGVESSDQRLIGVKEVIAETPWMKIIDQVSDENDDAMAASLVNAAWIGNHGLDVIIAVAPRNPIGAISVLKEKGIAPGTVLITGWDKDQDVLQAIKDGWIWAVSTPKIGLMAQLAISILEAQHLGYLHPSTTDSGPQDIDVLPRKIEIEQNFINKDNVDEFLIS